MWTDVECIAKGRHDFLSSGRNKHPVLVVETPREAENSVEASGLRSGIERLLEVVAAAVEVRGPVGKGYCQLRLCLVTYARSFRPYIIGGPVKGSIALGDKNHHPVIVVGQFEFTVHHKFPVVNR